MGDVLRQIFYPLLLPAIVACVWAHAWAMKQEAASERMIGPLPVAVISPDDPSVIHLPAPLYGFSTDDGSFASVDDDGE
jgi:hypothetical protein